MLLSSLGHSGGVGGGGGPLYSSPGTLNGEDVPNDPGKMFIGGLSWQTTPESIREYFSQFGDLAEVMVMKDPATRRSRGFGFITFCEPEAVDKVLGVTHTLDGKIVEPKIAVPRKSNPKFVMRTKKIFLGGLSASTSLEDIKSYFEQFCTVKDAMLAFDKVTHRHRGFGFVTFENEDVVDKICEIHFHDINGKMVESKKALPKEPRPSFYGGFGHHHPLSGAYYHPQRPGAPNFYNQLPCNSMYRPYENQSPGSEHHPNYIFDNRYFRYPRANGRNNINNDSSSGGSNGSNTALYEPDARGSYSHSRTMDHLYAQHNSNNNISSSNNNNNTQQQQHQQQHHHHYRALSSSTAAPLLSSSVISHHLSTSSNRNNDLRSEEAVAASYYLALDNYIQAGGDSGENYEEDFPELTSKFSQFRFGGGEEGSEPLEQGDEEEGRHSVTQTEDSAGSNSPQSNVNNHYGF